MQNEEQKKEKSPAALREEAVLEYWKENDIFKKTLNKKSPEGDFVFYEGPPGANGIPMLHHFEARAFKDVIPRYKTMRGYHVPRRAGWDCHGLPVELQAEKELNLGSKKDIETLGIEKFNAYCRGLVVRYTNEWDVFTQRMGYWIDNDHAYYTMGSDFIESSWHIVAEAAKRGNLYQDYKIIPWCARCGTGLSSHELGQPGVYEDVKDLSVTAKFKIIGFDNAYFLAWTTTPWTLPGNVGLAVGKDIDYVEAKVGDEILVLAKERLSVLSESYEIIAEHKGSEMIGMGYEPLYPYLAQEISGAEKEKMQNAYKVYVADFVTTTDGTGIVHTAVMYGADDFDLGTKVGLPKFHTVDAAGHFISGTDFLQGRFVKDEEVAVDIIKDLAHRGLLFKKEKFEHSYPHCWRCKTPLIYYARSSWYFAMSKLRKELVALNNDINWEPEYIKEGRFGEWLREIRDWAVSRERYWGTPLPVWLADDGERIVVDSYNTLKKYTKKSGNSYFVMRHGQTEGNIQGLICSISAGKYHLTDEGKKTVRANAKKLVGKGIEMIVTSPFHRAEETADIVRDVLGLDKNIVTTDARLGEFQVTSFEGQKWKDYHQMFAKTIENFNAKRENDESYADVKRRMTDFLYELESKYKNKKILIVTHGGPGWLLLAGAEGKNVNDTLEMIRHTKDYHYLENADVQEIPFVPLPHNDDYELDPHRPFIDDVVLEKNGKEFRRVKEVMDVWFDSGAMPFAQEHYPFEKNSHFQPKKGFLKNQHGYPADFISEAIDQTRGWFYTLVAVAALTGNSAPFKNVICLGHLLDAKGQKMSKSKGNVIEPWAQMEKFGADALRLWMYSITQPGDSKNFDEKTVAEINGKVFTLLYNVLSFYELYRDEKIESAANNNSANVLDVWIMARLNQLIADCTTNLDTYKVLEPVRAIRDFIGDLSTWYLRRSRDRIKDGDTNAKQTLYVVLKTVAQLLAPFAPFAAEDIWQKLKTSSDSESVHLSKWPEAGKINSQILKNMRIVREVVSLGLEARQKAKIAVRQPLAKLIVKNLELDAAYLELMKDELNVKEISEDKAIEGDIVLDVEITPELKKEGDYRELVRMIQDVRKEKGLTPSDIVDLTLPEQYKETIDSFEENLKKTVLAKSVAFSGEEIKVEK